MRSGAVLASVLLLALVPSAARAQEGGFCSGAMEVDAKRSAGAPAMRFGVTPSGAAGQLGPVPSRFAPDQPARILDALSRLRAPGRPFVTHVYSSWKNAGPAEDARLRELADRYAAAGHLVEFVIRYHPAPEREGDVAGFAAHVRRMVRLLGPNPAVIAFQVTNEVNFDVSPDSSDGAFERAREALIEGVVAGHAEARARGHRQLEMGFNWLWRWSPEKDQSFWEELRDRGGKRFVDALGWIGIDMYPGTFYPPSVAPGQERGFAINALGTLRCYAAIPGIPRRVPIHVQENGFPTGPGRTYERQAEALRNMVQAVHDARGVYNVSDYRWFNLRDAETASPNFQQQYGLMTDDYRPKPAFFEYARLVRALSGDGVPPAPGGQGERRGCRDLARPSSVLRARGRTLRGTARDRGCAGLRLVVVAVGLETGRGCRWLRPSGRLGRRGSCARTPYLAARGTRRFALRLPRRLPRGRYKAWSRAIDRAGNYERKNRRRNLTHFRVRRQ
jgi:hypothetical protein